MGKLREVTEAELAQLQGWARSSRTPSRLRQRSCIVLALAGGTPVKRIVRELRTAKDVVARWRERFNEAGPDGLRKDRPRRVPEGLPEEKVRAIVEATLHTTPRGATHWTTRTMARAQGVSQSAVMRIWHANGLKPHLMRTFKLSNDKRFVEKVKDVVGLYMNPPENALVLSVDEKSQIQALDRTQPGLPIKKGRCGTMTHDYKRNGTTTLFTALDVSRGTVITECMPRHRHQEFLKFMRLVERETPANLALHVIVDNYATHKHPAVQRWLRRNKRVKMHFIPTSSSWLNLVERWFRDLTDKAIRRGAFASVDELIDAITAYIDEWNRQPTTYVWRKSAQQILDKVMRGRAKLDSLH
jgi:transposase